ncbi:hypothetical protein PVAND_012908 [Polypedilum vanderplanki]|uniref:Tectonic domain-containing protein n=1 Tax=Polypedilum vanderplanki TaxID=319348 RepID=A0A9J6CNU3_POLVA|nr:hypothetical protein PVAND_012908 [Polypedilum vanderplanki]
MVCIVCENNVTTTTISLTMSEAVTKQSITSTTASTTTTSVAAPSLENSTKLAHKPSLSNRTIFLNTTSYVCSCDLTFNCDINCCCDLDCNDEIIKAFQCVTDLDIDDFYHSEGLERCTVDSSLLCIAHDNVPSIDFEIQVPFHVEYSKYEWPKNLLASQNLEPQHRETLSSHDFYKYGDAIMAYDLKSEKYEPINVPASTIGEDSRCFLTEPVKFLKSKSIKCLRSINALCSYNAELMLQLLNAQHRPRKMTAMSSSKDVFDVVIESCKHTHNNCTQISTTYANDNGSSSINAEVLELLTEDVYEDIHFKFLINDTKILSATVKFGCNNELTCNVDDFEPSPKIMQTIEIEFVNINENRNEKRVRMKSRGYKNDETIFASRYRPLNDTANASEMIFDYFHNDTKNFIMKLPQIKHGSKCHLMNDQYDQISFNENSQISCRVELTRDANINFTICQQAQQQLIHFLFNTLNLTSNYSRDGYLSDVYVSKFWTPRFDVDSWTRVSVHNMPYWSPEMQESEKMLTCSHIITTANYKFFYSTVKTSGTKKYENFIKSVLVEFGHVDELQLPPIDDDNNTMTHVDIQINVQFIGLSQKTVKNHAIVMKFDFLIIFIGVLLHL